MLTFHPLTVAALEHTAEDAVCISLDVPPDLAGHFAFHAGHYVPVRRILDGREELRTYSIVTAPGAKRLKIGVRVQPKGRMSSHLAAVRPGDVLEIGTPAGRFRTAIDPARVQTYAAFAAGSGITPVLSLATALLAREPASRFTLIYGNRTMARTMFLEEIFALKNRYLERFAVHFVMSREPQHAEILNGRIDGAKVRELARSIEAVRTAHEYFLCGPDSMTSEVRTALVEVNPGAAIKVERFAAAARPATDGALGTGGSTAAAGPAASNDPAATGAPAVQPEPAGLEELSTISVTMDGRTRSFPMTVADASVLDAAERAGLELPFSCRSGICATCRARVTAGTAVMTHNIALAQWEIDAGFVLCCQARPNTPRLELNYDQK